MTVVTATAAVMYDVQASNSCGPDDIHVHRSSRREYEHFPLQPP